MSLTLFQLRLIIKLNYIMYFFRAWAARKQRLDECLELQVCCHLVSTLFQFTTAFDCLDNDGGQIVTCVLFRFDEK